MTSGCAPVQSPFIAYCGVRHRLLDEFTEAVQDLGMLQDQQVSALLNGDQEFSRFDILLHLATERKQRAKYAYISHVEAHGCGLSKEIPTE
jgi:hypothetical protein